MFTPDKVAKNYVKTGKKKSELSISKMILLGIMAGMFIAFAAAASNTAPATVANASLVRVLAGLSFPLGLAMVLLAGSELFTGNCLMIIPVLEKKIKVTGMLKNWIFVYIGNFIGSALIAVITYYSGQYDLFGGAVAVTTIRVASAKCSLDFSKAFLLGILCNFLVCIAVWISFAAEDVAGKIIGLFLPIMTFVLCGFEHSIANMYYITAGLLASANPAYSAAAAEAGINMENLTLAGFFGGNLLPVTLGNIVGGMVLAGCSYWFIYLRKAEK